MGSDAMRQLPVACRIDTVQPGADHGNGCEMRCFRCRRGGGHRVERTQMRCAIDTQRQPGNYGDALLAESACKRACIALPLGRRVAAADDCNAAAQLRQVESRRTQQIQHHGRVGGFEQRRWIHRIAQGHDAARGTVDLAGLQPLPCPVEQFGQACGYPLQCGSLRHRDDLLQRCAGLGQHGIGQTESRQQFARASVPDARRQCKSQPAREFFMFQAGERSRVEP